MKKFAFMLLGALLGGVVGYITIVLATRIFERLAGMPKVASGGTLDKVLQSTPRWGV